jgi:flagellar basal-body rod protein FlgB
MDDLSSALIIKALDGLTARSVATSQNVANASTRGYRPVRVSFEKELSQAALRGPDAVRALEPRFEVAAAGDALRLDLELATASSTAGRYGALVELLNRQLQLRAIAVKGG